MSTQDGDTALMLASQNGMTEVVTQLVKAGSALDLQKEVWFTSEIWFIVCVCVCVCV